MLDDSTDATQHEIKIDLQGLIRLLAKNLYAEADVFIRELIQNAHDSLKRRAECEPAAAQGKIRIRIDRRGGTITISDNGSGLSESEIHEYLSTIGRSGTGAFRQELIRKGRQAEVTVIGQFGIGLLSAFVVAYRVEVETLSVWPGNPSWLWVSEGQRNYEIRPGTRETVGTTVTLYISDDYRDMLHVEELRRAIKKYADFIPYPIFLNDEYTPTNAVNAPWHLKFESERDRLMEYKDFVSRRFPDYCLEVIPVELTTPFTVHGVLYISNQRVPDLNTTGMVDVYQARMFVTSNNRDLLPSWAKFVRGVIDSPDLTLTASRDAIQLDTTAREIRDALGEVIVQHLQKLAETEPERFERILDWHSYHIKGMAVAYDDFFLAVADLAPFETNKGLMSLRQYCENAPALRRRKGEDIFYFREQGSATQFYMLCNAKGLLVINASYIFEEQFLKKYAERHPEIRLHHISVTGSEFLFESILPGEVAAFRNLERDFQRIVPTSQIRVVRFQPDTLPAVTILTSDMKLRQEMEYNMDNLTMPASVRDVLGRVLNERPAPPLILYLNAENATIQQMARMALVNEGKGEAYRTAIRAICNNALLLAQHLITPENAQDIFASSNQAICLLIEQAEQMDAWQERFKTMEQMLREKGLTEADITDVMQRLEAEP